ncbi:head-tail connector protein [Sphingomonas sp. WKB10]|nr:head-tail connector protein [Sphingomonas sp. WKB10]
METTTIITPDEVKSWCRIDTDADDTTIDLLILAAQAQASAYTGLALDPATCPPAIKQAVAVFVADMYANREGQTVGDKTFYRLLAPFRVGGM